MPFLSVQRQASSLAQDQAQHLKNYSSGCRFCIQYRWAMGEDSGEAPTPRAKENADGRALFTTHPSAILHLCPCFPPDVWHMHSNMIYLDLLPFFRDLIRAWVLSTGSVLFPLLLVDLDRLQTMSKLHSSQCGHFASTCIFCNSSAISST